MSFIFLRNRVTGGAAFSPASLFASGENGVWYEPSPTTCFTDTAGTTAAGVGDAVARINDLSGNGNHATQVTAAARPLLQQTAGGLYYLEFNGVDDHLLVPAAATQSLAVASFFVGYESADVTQTRSVLSYLISNETFSYVPITLSSKNFVRVGLESAAATAITTTIANDTPYVSTAILDAAAPSLTSRLNGSDVGTVTNLGAAGALTTLNMAIGARQRTGSVVDLHFVGKVYSVIIRGAITSGGDLSNAETYVASKSGVTL